MREMLLRGALRADVPTQLFLDALRVYVGKSPIYLSEESGPDKLFACELEVGTDAAVRVAA